MIRRVASRPVKSQSAADLNINRYFARSTDIGRVHAPDSSVTHDTWKSDRHWRVHRAKIKPTSRPGNVLGSQGHNGRAGGPASFEELIQPSSKSWRTNCIHVLAM